MKNKELIKCVIRKYEQLQDVSNDIPISSGRRTNLIRGNKHSISSYLEDVTAAFVSDHLKPKKDYGIRIDQTFYPENSRSQFRPDICIIKKKPTPMIVGFIEVKDSPNPFRWQSEKEQNRGIEYVNTRLYALRDFRGNILKYKDATHGTTEIPVHKKAQLDLVLFSKSMFPRDKYNNLVNTCKKNSCITLHVLLKKYHPNVKNTSIKSEWLIEQIDKDSKGLLYSEDSLIKRIEMIKLM